MQISVSNFFIQNLYLDRFNKNDKRRILSIIFKYILGINSYSNTLKDLKEYELNLNFSRCMKHIKKDYLQYFFITFRRYAKKLKGKVKKLDKYYLNLFRKVTRLNTRIIYKTIKLFKKFPDFNKTYYQYRPLVISNTKSVYSKVYWDKSIQFEDISSIFYIKMYHTYIKYIFSMGNIDFSKGAFYQCIVNSIRNKRLDLLRFFFTKKMSTVRSSVSYDGLCENLLEHKIQENTLYA